MTGGREVYRTVLFTLTYQVMGTLSQLELKDFFDF